MATNDYPYNLGKRYKWFEGVHYVAALTPWNRTDEHHTMTWEPPLLPVRNMYLYSWFLEYNGCFLEAVIARCNGVGVPITIFARFRFEQTGRKRGRLRPAIEAWLTDLNCGKY